MKFDKMIKSVVAYSQCNQTAECQNCRCFFKQRDCFGRSYWINTFLSDEEWEKDDLFFEQFGEVLYPTFSGTFGMNCIHVICNHFISEKDKDDN